MTVKVLIEDLIMIWKSMSKSLKFWMNEWKMIFFFLLVPCNHSCNHHRSLGWIFVKGLIRGNNSLELLVCFPTSCSSVPVQSMDLCPSLWPWERHWHGPVGEPAAFCHLNALYCSSALQSCHEGTCTSWLFCNCRGISSPQNCSSSSLEQFRFNRKSERAELTPGTLVNQLTEYICIDWVKLTE